jgi:hypothetical protein
MIGKAAPGPFELASNVDARIGSRYSQRRRDPGSGRPDRKTNQGAERIVSDD